MSVFHDYEKKALRLLVGNFLGPAMIDTVLREAALRSVHVSGSDYRIEVTHAGLPVQDNRFDEPIVIGRHDDIEVRLTASINNHVLRLFGKSTGSAGIPENFRQRDVDIAVV